MKKVILAVFIIFILSSFVLAQECQDTDGGIDYYEKGVAFIYESDKENTEDYCTNEHQLREYYCKESSTGVASDHYTCPEGCLDGACLGEEVPLGEEECFDSDKGPMLYEKGHTIDKQHEGDYWDVCLNNGTLREYFCGEKNYQYYSFECSDGCKDGACQHLTSKRSWWETCEVSDPLYPIWININVKGKVTLTGPNKTEVYEEICEGDKVVEYICGLEGALEIKLDCTYGCKDGACLSPKYIEPEEESEIPLDIPEDTEDKTYVCMGCSLNEKCYPYGFRKDGKFCSDVEEEFILQKDKESSCENSFECTSNLCLEDECLSKSILAKFVRWIKNLFG